MKLFIKNTLLILAILIPALVNAYDFEVDGIYYNINRKGVTVTYNGVFPDNCYSGEIVIPETVTYNNVNYSVTAIGNEAFYFSSNLSSVVIPNSVTSIGDYAFQCCSNLTTVQIPNSVATIGEFAFESCNSMTSIEIPNSVTTIERRAFSGCICLTSIVIPNSVVAIGEEAFWGTPWYDNQPNGLVYAGSVAYKYKGTMPIDTTITLKEGTLGIAADAFSGCTGLTDILIPNTVISIGKYAFSGTTWDNNLPNGLVYAGSVAYKYKGTMPIDTTITLKEGTLGIAADAFSGCTGLTNILIPNTLQFIGEDAFSSCDGLTSVDIPNSVTTIGDGAFIYCYNLTNIEIPNSVTHIGNYAFNYCSNLKNIVVSSYNEYYDSRINCNAIIESANNILLVGCQNTIIPNSVTTIGLAAFANCTNLKSIEIPNSVRYIQAYAFESCPNLSSITIPTSIEYISSEDVFPYSISTLTITGNGVLQGTIHTSSDLLYIRDKVTGIYDTRFSQSEVYSFAPIPPLCNSISFTDYSGTLHVPASSLAAYFTAPYWCNFERIVGDAVEPTGITINIDSIEIQLSEQVELTATVTPSNSSYKDIVWYSNNPIVATVNNGIVTAFGYGECDIIASCFGLKAICHVVVSNRINLDIQDAMLLPNHMLIITPSFSPSILNLEVTSSDPTVAAARLMNGQVQVVGIKEGTTTVTVGSTDGTAMPATCLVTVYTETGDVNMDGFTDISDVSQLIDFLLGNDITNFKEANGDLDGDGEVGISDVSALIDLLLTS